MEHLFTRELVILDLDVDNIDDLLKTVGKKLFDMKYVTETFVDAIIEREHLYPTGLTTSSFPIAVPHANTTHVSKKGVVFVKLNEGITVNEMVSLNPIENVRYFFVLLIDEPKHQVELLQYIMRFCMDNEKMEILDQITDKDSLVEFLNGMSKETEEKKGGK